MAKLALAFECIKNSSVPLIPVLKRNNVQRIAMNTHPFKQPSEKQCSKDEYIYSNFAKEVTWQSG